MDPKPRPDRALVIFLCAFALLELAGIAFSIVKLLSRPG
jgi:hypothetical protein